MVSLVVEPVGRALLFARLARSRRVGAAGQPPRPAAQAPCARALMPMQAPMGGAHSGQPVGQSVAHLAGTAAAGMVRGPRLLGSTGPPWRQDVPHRRRPRWRCGPCAQGAHAGGPRGGGGRARPLPPRLRQRQSLAAAVAELQDAVQAAQAHRQRRPQHVPGLVGRLPAGGVDGWGSVWRLDWAGFRRARALGVAQMLVVGRLGPGDPPPTALARRDGDGGFFAAPRGGLCVGRARLGQRLRVAPGGAHEAMAAAPFALPIPVGRVVSEGLGHQPRGHARGAPSPRVRDVFRATSHGRQDEAGPQRVPRTALQPPWPQAHARQRGRRAQAAGQSRALR
jgi:hypothetical protein